MVYASAMGRKWLAPDLDNVMKWLPQEGNKNVIVICPGFPADNLETLYDVHIKAREIFMKNGGESFRFIPCLNSEEYWVEAIVKMVTSK
jgi:ferrochelatase